MNIRIYIHQHMPEYAVTLHKVHTYECTDHVSWMQSSTEMLGHIGLTKHRTTLTDYSSVSFSNTLATH